MISASEPTKVADRDIVSKGKSTKSKAKGLLSFSGLGRTSRNPKNKGVLQLSADREDASCRLEKEQERITYYQRRVLEQQTIIQSLTGSLRREKQIQEQYHDDWEETQEKLFSLDRENAALHNRLNRLNREMQNLKDAYTILRFKQLPKPLAEFPFLLPVDYSVQESTNKVGSFLVDGFLGSGSYGSVWMVHTKGKQSEKIALKSIDKDCIDSMTLLRQLNREVQVLKEYPHPNIVKLLEVFHAEKHFYLAMELGWMDIHTLNEHYGLSHRSVRQVLLGVLRALDHLHSVARCGHLDVKPENILLASAVNGKHSLRAENIRLCDFGFCIFSDDPDREKDQLRMIGTPGFFAPEMISAREWEPTAADMWSVGASLLDLTVGLPNGWMESYSFHKKLPEKFRSDIGQYILALNRRTWGDGDLQDLLMQHLLVPAQKRCTAEKALQHSWMTKTVERSSSLC